MAQHSSRPFAGPLAAATFPPVGRCRILLPKRRTARPRRLRVDVFQEAEMLRKVPFFGGLDPAKLKLLAFTSRAVRFGPGELLMTRGDPPDSVYVIIEGEVEIVGETPAGEFIVAVVGPQRAAGRNGRHLEYASRGHRARADARARAAHRRGRFPAPPHRKPRLCIARDARIERARGRRQCPRRSGAARRRNAEGTARRPPPMSSATAPRRDAMQDAGTAHRVRVPMEARAR